MWLKHFSLKVKLKQTKLYLRQNERPHADSDVYHLIINFVFISVC